MKTLLMVLLFAVSARAEQQISLIGLTLHMTPINKATSEILKNKVTSNGDFVYNLQLNYMAINDEGKLLHGAALLDCFGHGAGFLAYGKRYEVEKNFYLGWELGFYARQRPVTPDEEAGTQTPFKSGIYEFFPSPAFIAQYRLSEHVMIRAQSNVILNSFDLAWSF